MKSLYIILFLLWATPSSGQSITSETCYKKTLAISNSKGNKAALKYIKKRNHKTWGANPELLYLEGVLRFSTNKFKNKKNEDVIKIFSKYINERPNEAKGYFRRGIAYLALDYENLAISDFNTALSIDEAITSAYFYKAQALFQLSSYLEAISNYSQFIELVDTSNSLYNTASFHRALSNKKLKRVSGLGNYKGWKSNPLIYRHTFPITTLPFDTAENSGLKINRFLIPIPKSVTRDTISIGTLTNINSLNKLFGTQSLDTFRITIIKVGLKYNIDYNNWIVYTNTNNELNESIIKNLIKLSINDEVHIDKVVGKNDKREKVFPPPKKYRVKITYDKNG